MKNKIVKIVFTIILSLIVLVSCEKKKSKEEIPLEPSALTTMVSSSPDTVVICSFNIQFLGHFTKKKHKDLADILKTYDIVIIQELVAPPASGQYPDGSLYNADTQANEFFAAMDSLGFSYILSEEDTGTNDEIHKNSSATEWWVAFYNPRKVEPTDQIPGGFLAEDRSNHDDYERVPYAFPFKNKTNTMDFVLISVHLDPEKKQRRSHEIASINSWIQTNSQIEMDFIILGDMNIQDSTELVAITPSGYLSLNNECLITNTNVNGPKPYDHVMYETTNTQNEVDEQFGFAVVDLIEKMESYWDTSDPYPGKDPYNHNLFKQYYSDHHPVIFRLASSADDD